MLCIRKDSHPGMLDTWTVLAKWGRRGKGMSVQPKGSYASESLAYQARMNLWSEQCRKGYLDITSNEYIAHMLKMNSANQPLRMDMKEIMDNLEAEPGQVSVTPRRITWQCESCGKDFHPKLDEKGFPESTRDVLCSDCHEKMSRIAKKHQENGGDQVMVCVDNTGMDDRFDVGIEYIVEDHTNDKTMILVFDKMGRKDIYFRNRFLTPEQWDKKQGKIKVKAIKNREFKPGNKFRLIRPNPDVELTDKQIGQLLKHRGGCTCHTGHPPCQACTDPITADEYEELGFGEIISSLPQAKKHFNINGDEIE